MGRGRTRSEISHHLDVILCVAPPVLKKGEKNNWGENCSHRSDEDWCAIEDWQLGFAFLVAFAVIACSSARCLHSASPIPAVAHVCLMIFASCGRVDPSAGRAHPFVRDVFSASSAVVDGWCDFGLLVFGWLGSFFSGWCFFVELPFFLVYLSPTLCSGY